MERYIDCYTPLRPQDASAVRFAGYTGVCRYLGAKTRGWPKGLTPEEVDSNKAEQLSIVSIWEGEATSSTYFTTDQALHDAQDALVEAEWLGQPQGTAIYFAVDLDTDAADMPAIRAYFATIIKVMAGRYKVGVYGGIQTMETLYTAEIKPDHYWQTLAWSDGALFPHADLYQSAISQWIGTLGVDIDEVCGSPGSWPVKEVGGAMQIGANSDAVKTLQAQLNTVLGTHITEDGTYSAQTAAAVKSYQQIHHLPVTGVADVGTLSLLKETLAAHEHAVVASAQQARADKVQRVTELLAQAQELIKSL